MGGATPLPMHPWQVVFDSEAWYLIFYTGKEPIVLGTALPPNVLLLEGRPELDHNNAETMDVIRWIIYGIETAEGLPENMVNEALDFERRARALDAELRAEPQGPEDLIWKSIQRLCFHFTVEQL